MKTSGIMAALPAQDLGEPKRSTTRKWDFRHSNPTFSRHEMGVGLAVGDGVNQLFVHPARARSSGEFTQAVIHVTDARAAVEEMRGRGVEFEEYDAPETRTENGVAAMPGGRRGGVIQGLGRQPGPRCSSLRRISRVSELPRRVAYPAPSRLTNSELVDLRGASRQGGIDYSDDGGSDLPLVLLQHFRGNLDNWDPALIDDLTPGRRVITFNNRGVASTTGMTPNTIEAMAHDAISFIDAMGFKKVDLLGFSIGSFVAQEIALIRPGLLRRLMLASSAPQGADGMHGWAADVIGAVGEPEPNPQGYLDVFFAHSSTSQRAGQQAAGRIFGKKSNQDAPTNWQTRQAQYDAVCSWGIPNHSLLRRVSTIDVPVFVANGDSDPMILPRYSYLLTGLLPDARLKIYPDSAHGFLFQHHSEFAADVHAFLAEPV